MEDFGETGAKIFSRQLIANYNKYFKRMRNHRYHLVIVNNHFFDRIYFFLQDQKAGELLHYSHDLMDMPWDRKLYDDVMTDFRKHSQMTIEFRNTHKPVYPGRINVHDNVHGHSTAYRHES